MFCVSLSNLLHFVILNYFCSCCYLLINFINNPQYIFVFQMPLGHLEGGLKTLQESARPFHFLGIRMEQSGNQGDIPALKCLSCPAFCWNIKSRCERVESDACEAAAEETNMLRLIWIFSHIKSTHREFMFTVGKNGLVEVRIPKNETWIFLSPFLQSNTLQTHCVLEALQHVWLNLFVCVFFYLSQFFYFAPNCFYIDKPPTSTFSPFLSFTLLCLT